MSYYANLARRAELIAGFRELADYLESNPQVPAPNYADVFTFPPDGGWAEMCAEIDAIAGLLGVIALQAGGHYVATRSFGPLEYRAVAIPRAGKEEGER
jgi:hypothetical protein